MKQRGASSAFSAIALINSFTRWSANHVVHGYFGERWEAVLHPTVGLISSQVTEVTP